MQKAAYFPIFASVVLGLASCNNPNEDLQLATGTVASTDALTTKALYGEGYSYEAAGNSSKAIKRYNTLADKYPFAIEAPDARFRQAELLHSSGQLLKSFDAYQDFIARYYGQKLYSKALARQAEVAQAAAGGDIKTSFLGLKSNVAASKAEKMLIQVRDNAPYGSTAPIAQFSIGRLWHSNKNYVKAIKAYQEVQIRYPKSSLAPEALLRAGNLLVDQSASGNRNKANLDTARTVLQDLRRLYPSSKQAGAAKTTLAHIASSDVKRSYEIAEFYRNKKEFASAAFYYNEVIRRTKPGSSYYKMAKSGLSAVSQ